MCETYDIKGKLGVGIDLTCPEGLVVSILNYSEGIADYLTEDEALELAYLILNKLGKNTSHVTVFSPDLSINVKEL